jgi:hypothetical protein
MGTIQVVAHALPELGLFHSSLSEQAWLDPGQLLPSRRGRVGGAADHGGPCPARQRRVLILEWRIGLCRWSIHFGGVHSGSRSELIRQIQPRPAKL